MKHAKVLHASPADEFMTAERCWIWELSNLADDPAVSIAQARVASGETTAWHCLDGVEERYVILSGEGVVEVGEHVPQNVGVGSVVHIPAGVRQRIRNRGAEDLIFYAVCTPRFTPECYVALED